MLDKVKFWFRASRGYSLPMSILSFLVVFVWCLKLNGNIFYGLLSLVGIAFSQLGTNLFDDFIDFKNHVPKQDAKRVYFEESNVTLKTIFFASFSCFLISAIIGIFFVIKIGIPVLIISFITGVLCLLYPRLNHYSLGELFLFLIFGPNIFYGVSLVMGVSFSKELFVVSVLVGILTVILLLAHAFMDYDGDKKSNKKTILVRLGSKERALNFVFFLIILSYFIITLIMYFNVVSYVALASFLTLYMAYRLYKYLKEYIRTPNPKMFLRNFILTRNLVSSIDIILALAILIK